MKKRFWILSGIIPAIGILAWLGALFCNRQEEVLPPPTLQEIALQRGIPNPFYPSPPGRFL